MARRTSLWIYRTMLLLTSHGSALIAAIALHTPHGESHRDIWLFNLALFSGIAALLGLRDRGWGVLLLGAAVIAIGCGVAGGLDPTLLVPLLTVALLSVVSGSVILWRADRTATLAIALLSSTLGLSTSWAAARMPPPERAREINCSAAAEDPLERFRGKIADPLEQARAAAYCDLRRGSLRLFNLAMRHPEAGPEPRILSLGGVEIRALGHDVPLWVRVFAREYNAAMEPMIDRTYGAQLRSTVRKRVLRADKDEIAQRSRPPIGCSFPAYRHGRPEAASVRHWWVQKTEAQVDGALSPEVVRRVLGRHRNEVAYCGTQAGSRRTISSQRVSAEFTISATGRVTDASTTATSESQAFRRCLRKAVQRWAFPASLDGKEVKVRAMFMLRGPPRFD